MTSPGFLDERFGQKQVLNAPRGTSGDFHEIDGAWQKHVIIALWILMAAAVVFAFALIRAESHGGLFGTPVDQTMQSGAFPANWS